MNTSYGYRDYFSRGEGILVFVLMAAWSIASIVLVGSQNGVLA